MGIGWLWKDDSQTEFERELFLKKISELQFDVLQAEEKILDLQYQLSDFKNKNNILDKRYELAEKIYFELIKNGSDCDIDTASLAVSAAENLHEIYIKRFSDYKG